MPVDAGTGFEAKMTASKDFDAMAEACIANHAAIEEYGSPAMSTASRLLLFALAEEIRRRAESEAPHPDPAD